VLVVIIISDSGVIEGVLVARVEGVVEVGSRDAISVAGKLTVVDGCRVGNLSTGINSVPDDTHPATRIAINNRWSSNTYRIIC
jgi:hypothetical protein